MPKNSKKRHRSPRKRIWERGDGIELLAYLDYCLEHGIDFESTKISHLKAVTGKDFSEEQVSGKLRREWKGYGRQGPNTVQDLLSEGSPFLVGYIDIDREDIREAISRIEPPASRYRLRSASSALLSRRRTPPKPRQPSETPTLSTHATSEFRDLDDVQAGPGGEELAGKKACAFPRSQIAWIMLTWRPCRLRQKRARDQVLCYRLKT